MCAGEGRGGILRDQQGEKAAREAGGLCQGTQFFSKFFYKYYVIFCPLRQLNPCLHSWSFVIVNSAGTFCILSVITKEKKLRTIFYNWGRFVREAQRLFLGFL
jgi:hypothetical protein